MPVKIASWLLPMHRKCCHNVVDCTQCIESRYDCRYLFIYLFFVNMFWESVNTDNDDGLLYSEKRCAL